MSARAWIVLLAVTAVSLGALALALAQTAKSPRPAASIEAPEANAAVDTAADLDREYEELRRAAEINAQLAADERNMQINMAMDELNVLGEPLPVEAAAEPAD